MKIFILGATGMLGHTMFKVLSENPAWEVYGSVRNKSARSFFSDDLSNRLITDLDVENHDLLLKAFATVRPDVVINCIGLVKQLAESNEPLKAVPINTLLPHRLAALCLLEGARLVHFSTDCVFSGADGNYRESDFPDARDLYGRTKLLGEVDESHVITLRTSIIGHELSGKRSLIEWFLSQKNAVTGFSRAIFTGLPTVEVSHVIRDIVLPRSELHGLYHVASRPIAKFDLLRIVAQVYGKDIEIIPDNSLVIDRSLDASRFEAATGYVPADWQSLIELMHEYK